MRKLPIPNISPAEQKPFELLVNKIIDAKRINPQADTFIMEREIDQLVYKLYDLTPEEIKIVEGEKSK